MLVGGLFGVINALSAKVLDVDNDFDFGSGVKESFLPETGAADPLDLSPGYLGVPLTTGVTDFCNSSFIMPSSEFDLGFGFIEEPSSGFLIFWGEVHAWDFAIGVFDT